MAGRLLLILSLDRMTALMVGAARTTEEKIMSTVYTMATLQNRSDFELQAMIRRAQYDLACSTPGSSRSLPVPTRI